MIMTAGEGAESCVRGQWQLPLQPHLLSWDQVAVNFFAKSVNVVNPFLLFGIRSPLVAAVVQAAVQVVLKMNNMDFMRMVVILMPREPPVVGGAGWKSTWWPR